MQIDLYVKYPLFLSDFSDTWTFLTDFRKVLKYENSWKSAKLEASCPTWTDGRTDEQKKLIVTFRNFANKLKNASYQDNVKEDTLPYVINSNTIDQIFERLWWLWLWLGITKKKGCEEKNTILT